MPAAALHYSRRPCCGARVLRQRARNQFTITSGQTCYLRDWIRRVHTSYISIHYLSVIKQCAYMAPKHTSYSTKSYDKKLGHT